MNDVFLTEEQRRQFAEEGYLIVRGVLDNKQIGPLLEAGDRLMASGSQENRLTWSHSDQLRNVVGMDDAFLPLLAHPATFPLIADLYGYNLNLNSSAYVHRFADGPDKPETTRCPGWHRDVAGSSRDLGHDKVPNMSVKVAYYLTDVSEPQSGATLLLPGSNNLKTELPIRKGSVDPEKVLEPSLRPGDALFFENRTWHAGGLNRSGRTRKCVIFGYAFRWVASDRGLPEATAKKVQADPVALQLIGATRNASGAYTPGGGNEALRAWCERRAARKKELEALTA